MEEVYEVKKLDRPVHWVTEVPGSKSITNRALLIAALTGGTVTLKGVLFSDDSRCFLGALQSLGVPVEVREEKKQVTVTGCCGRIPRKEGEVYVGSAGTAARFLTAMLGLSEGTYVIQASPQMQKRPMKPVFEALLSLGAEMEWLGEKWHLPVRITGAGMAAGSGGAKKETFLNLDISESTQFLSAFLLISPMFAGGLRIHITSPKKEGAYIRITRKMMEDFGAKVLFDGTDYRIMPETSYNRTEYQIEPDVSAACYFYGAAAVTGGRAKVLHVYRDGMQGDLKFLEALSRMGCEIREEQDGIAVHGPEPGKLHGIELDMNDFSDQALTLAAIAPYAGGPVEIRNVAHIRGQESDRIHAIVTNLKKAGIVCREYPDGVRIEPGQPSGCRISTFDDHRVAMAFSIMGLRTDGIIIENPGCCRKTFENYFDILDSLTRDNSGVR